MEFDPSKALDYGIASVVIWGVGYLAMRTGAWVGNELIKPIRDRMLAHLENVDTNIETNSKTMQAVAESLDATRRDTAEIKTIVKQIAS